MRGVSSRISREAAQNFIQLVELLVDQALQCGCFGWIFYQHASSVAVARTQPRTDGQCAGSVALPGCCSGAKQLVGDLGHRADHNHGLLALGNASGNDFRGSPNGGRILDRRTAKLHHYQVHAIASMVQQVSGQAARAAPHVVQACPGWPAIRRSGWRLPQLREWCCARAR